MPTTTLNRAILSVKHPVPALSVGVDVGPAQSWAEERWRSSCGEGICCIKCGISQPPTAYYESSLRSRKRVCKTCSRLLAAIHYQAKQAELQRKGREYNRARRQLNPELTHEQNLRHCREAAARLKSRQGEWRAAHPELAALIAAALAAEKAERKAVRRAKTLARRKANEPEMKGRKRRYNRLHFAEHREERTAYLREWKKKNRSRCNAHNRKRDALKLGNPAQNDPEVFAFYELVRTAPRLKCYICGRNTKPGERHVDHVIPLARGGAHVRTNLDCACATCNLTKAARPPEEFGLLPF